jgi:GNAT superfamily N-acetyltransferase
VPSARVRDVRDVDDELRAALLVCWTDVVNAGGAVGFVPPVTSDDVAPRLDATLAPVRAGRDALCLLEVDGEPAGFAFLVANDSPLRRHWCNVHRVQVHPSRQGAGWGRVLMRGVHDIARNRGWEFLLLSVRGGTGTEAFYAGLGYEPVGLIPGALRLAPGDDRDETWMRLVLRGRAGDGEGTT